MGAVRSVTCFKSLKPARLPFKAALTFCISRWKKLRRAGLVNTERVSPHLTARIVRGYVRHHRLGPHQLPDLIASVHRTLGQLGQQVQPEEVLTPAVSIRQSVRQDYVVCLDCGYRGKTLRRHISSRHGLSADEYLKRWGLRQDHPLTAPTYSEQRSGLAKQRGLGRKPGTEAASGPATAVSAASSLDKEVEATPRSKRSTRSESRSDAESEAASAPTRSRPRRRRSGVAAPQSEPLPAPTADA
jgi:predicted transcriptional regulator